MGVKEQLRKIKDNWLILALVLALVLVFSFSGNISRMSSNSFGGYMMGNQEYGAADYDGYSSQKSYIPNTGQGFAPEVENRKIIKTAYMSNEVDMGGFIDLETRLRNIVKSSDSFILSENVYNSGSEKNSYMTANYQIKVDTSKYDSVIAQLKEIGKVTSFRENANDVTGQYTNSQIELETEKERLKRYQEMYNNSLGVSDKITLNDRIYEEERKIKYLEDSIKNIDEKIDYSTIHFTLTEKKSDYANVSVVKFSHLIQNIVDSFNALITLLFVIIPWAIAALIIWLIWKFVKRS